MSNRPRVSRRMLAKRAEQGRQAMLMLASVVRHAGGIVKIPAEVYTTMQPSTRVEVYFDPLSALYTLKVPPDESETGPTPPAESR